MSVHVLEREQLVPTSPAATFELFSDAFALERITPPWLGFRVITPGPIEMAAGAVIGYILRLHRVPVRWLTRIEVWDPPRRFVDLQLEGPYRLWEHTHSFIPWETGTLIVDRVRYALPVWPFGELAWLAIVRRDLERIFDYRRQAIERLLGGQAGARALHRGAP
jgi:hypothetical protein